MKGRKWISVLLVIGVLFLGFTARIYGVSNDITQREVQSPNTLTNRVSIAEKVLTATGLTERFNPEDARNILLNYGDLLGDNKNELVVTIEFGPKNSIVAVYEPNGNNYQYVGNVGEFFYIRNIDFMPLESLGKEALIIREYANQDIGAFEQSSFIRGYIWDNGVFHEILHVPEGIESDWNRLWDGTTKNGESEWNRIEQRSDITYTGNGNPVLDILHYQAHRISTDTASKDLPNPSTYNTIKNRVVAETYRWNKDWNHFILSEKIDNRTGETVAVIEDFATSPYALLEEYGALVNKVRIERKNGETEIVEKDTLSDIDGAPSTDAFIAY